MTEPITLHKIVCSRCKKPIASGEFYPLVHLPDGSKAPVHVKCIQDTQAAP